MDARQQFQAALMALALLRWLQEPVVVVNQLNVSAGPMLIDNRGPASDKLAGRGE